MKKEKKLNAGMQALLEGRQPATDEASASAQDVTENEEEATEQEENELIDSIEDEQLKEALRQRQNRKRGRPRKGVVLEGRQEEVFTRFCTLVRKDQAAKLREICYRETLTLKELLQYVFGKAIESYEEYKGEVKPSKRKKKDAATIFGTMKL